MKAFLLAAGIGSRLRPLTATVPKCMLPIDGVPLIDIWLETLGQAGVDNVMVNVHHLPDVIVAHLKSSGPVPRVHTVFEPELLGSAGTLLANRNWVQDEEAFVVCYADNLTDFDLRTLIDAHYESRAIATCAVFRSDEPSRCGVVELDAASTIVEFAEKPTEPVTNLANAGIYAFHPDVLDTITGPVPQDIGYHLLPNLVGRAQAVTVEGFFRDIGTPESYRLAQQEWGSRSVRTVR